MASPAVRKAISDAALQYAKPEGKIFQYGTAGVRWIFPSYLYACLS